MKIPSDFDPLAWGERRYVQPILKGRGGNKYAAWGDTDESHPYSFRMSAGSNEADPYDNAKIWLAFDGDRSTKSGNYDAEHWHNRLVFEYPVRIVSMNMLLGAYRNHFYELYGVADGEDPITGGTKLGELYHS